MQVSQIMSTKLVSVTLDDSVAHVRELFNLYRFHHLLVVERRKLLGVISDRDLLKNISPFIGRELAERAQDVALLERKVHQIMTRKPVTVLPETSVNNAAQFMVSSSVSCLPVVNGNGQVEGIVTWKDLFAALVPGLQIPPVLREEDAEALGAAGDAPAGVTGQTADEAADEAQGSAEVDEMARLEADLSKLRAGMDEVASLVHEAIFPVGAGERKRG